MDADANQRWSARRQATAGPALRRTRRACRIASRSLRPCAWQAPPGPVGNAGHSRDLARCMLHGCCPHRHRYIVSRRACAACTAETCHAAFGAGCAPRAMLHAALLGAPAILPGADVGARQDQLHHRVGPPARGGDVQRRLPGAAGRRVSVQLVLTYPARAASTPEPCSADRWLTPSCHTKGFVSPHRRRCKTPTRCT